MNNINNILNHLHDNHHQYYWSEVKDINYPAVRLGNISEENVLFIFDDYNHCTKIERTVLRENGICTKLSDLIYSAGIIELSIVAGLIFQVNNYINENSNMDEVIQHEQIINTRKYINENFDSIS